MVSSMCILSGRLSSTTNGPVTSPKEIFPETRSELMARILARPPRAAKTLAITSFGVWAAAAAGSRERSAMQRVLGLMEFMVAAEHSEWRVASGEGKTGLKRIHAPGKAEAQRGSHTTGCGKS